VTSFATLEELQERLEWTLDSDEERIAEAALEDASELARSYGRDWVDAATAPRLIRTLVLKACARFMRNPAGYTQSKAGDESVMWSDRGDTALGEVYFTKGEQKMIAQLAGRTDGLSSAPITAWKSTITDNGTVPDGTISGKNFPLYEVGELLS